MKDMNISEIAEVLNKSVAEVMKMKIKEIDSLIGCPVRIVSMN